VSTGILSSAAKTPGTEYQHLSLFSDEVIKQLGSNTWHLCLHGLDRDNLTFIVYILAYTRSHRVLGCFGSQWEYIRHWFRAV